MGRIVDREAGIGYNRSQTLREPDPVGLDVDSAVRLRVVVDPRVAESGADGLYVEGDIPAAVAVGVVSQLRSAGPNGNDVGLGPPYAVLQLRAVERARGAGAPVVDENQVPLAGQWPELEQPEPPALAAAIPGPPSLTTIASIAFEAGSVCGKIVKPIAIFRPAGSARSNGTRTEPHSQPGSSVQGDSGTLWVGR